MPIAVVADIHANLDAFEAVIADWGEVEEVWCPGDVIGYGPEPNECMDRLRSFPHLVCVPGNHDYAAIGVLNTGEFNAAARIAAEWTAERLRPEHRRFLLSLQVIVTRGDVTITHGSPRDPIWEYMLTASQARANFAHFSTACCLIGHTHVPAIFVAEGEGAEQGLYAKPGTVVRTGKTRLMLNPGSVGQPRDHDARAAYALYDAASGRFEFRRVPYDIEATQAKMLRAGLPAVLAERLAHGW